MNPRAAPRGLLVRGLALTVLASSGWWIAAAAEPQGLEALLAWPLGSDGSVGHMLYSTHGQYYHVSDVPLAHQGIDIGATPHDPVLAVEDGTVVYRSLEDDGLEPMFQELIVSRGEELSRGIRYVHLGSFEVDVGDSVERGELLGTTVDWEDASADVPSCCFDHLHLQVVSRSAFGGGSEKAWAPASALDAGNPLPLFDTSADTTAPWCNPLPSDYAGSATVLFFEDGSDTELDPAHLSGKIDIVASLHDRVLGVLPETGVVGVPPETGGAEVPPEAPSGTAPCSDCAPSDEVVPCRVELRVTALDSAGLPGAPEQVFGPLELFGPVLPNTQEPIAKGIYHGESVGTYTKRDLRLILTHDLSTRAGAWSPSAPGMYRIEIVAADAAGNVLEMPPVDVTVESP